MTDLNSLALFAKIVEAGSFSEAARRLKMPISTVSRRIAEIEDQLGVRLLERSTRNLRLKSCCAGPDSRSASGVSGRHFGEAGSSSATRRDYVKWASQNNDDLRTGASRSLIARSSGGRASSGAGRKNRF